MSSEKLITFGQFVQEMLELRGKEEGNPFLNQSDLKGWAMKEDSSALQKRMEELAFTPEDPDQISGVSYPRNSPVD